MRVPPLTKLLLLKEKKKRKLYHKYPNNSSLYNALYHKIMQMTMKSTVNCQVQTSLLKKRGSVDLSNHEFIFVVGILPMPMPIKH